MTLQLSWRWSSSGLCISTLLPPKTKARGHCALWDKSICAQVPRTRAAKIWLMPQRFDRITLHKSRASKIEVRASPIILGHYVTHKWDLAADVDDELDRTHTVMLDGAWGTVRTQVPHRGCARVARNAIGLRLERNVPYTKEHERFRTFRPRWQYVK